ncbi:hypothetical protein GCM10009107_16320 [Ideonella azotifigens]|uniref:Uncharacterized protein n=1 Tax=Ideonella azotifigens TaxID=513160 RepID=A0ABN1JVS2_9BURK
MSPEWCVSSEKRQYFPFSHAYAGNKRETGANKKTSHPPKEGGCCDVAPLRDNAQQIWRANKARHPCHQGIQDQTCTFRKRWMANEKAFHTGMVLPSIFA